MKLPLISVVIGLLLGIFATMWLQPRTGSGAALLIMIVTLVVAIVVWILGKLVFRAKGEA